MPVRMRHNSRSDDAHQMEKKLIHFNTMPSTYWDDSVKISYLQRRILVYSIMYYENNESCISDYDYDTLSHQLVHMQQSVDENEFKKSSYYYAMYDFDGSTGFHLPARLTKKDREWLEKIAAIVHTQWKQATTFD